LDRNQTGHDGGPAGQGKAQLKVLKKVGKKAQGRDVYMPLGGEQDSEQDSKDEDDELQELESYFKNYATAQTELAIDNFGLLGSFLEAAKLEPGPDGVASSANRAREGLKGGPAKAQGATQKRRGLEMATTRELKLDESASRPLNLVLDTGHRKAQHGRPNQQEFQDLRIDNSKQGISA